MYFFHSLQALYNLNGFLDFIYDLLGKACIERKAISEVKVREVCSLS
jgi:hypothetical protein